VLGLIVSQELYRRHPTANEGDLSLMRQRVVAREPCARVAREAGLPEAMVASAPPASREAASGLAAQERVQAALCESVLGAAWLELGPEATERGVLEAFAEVIAGVAPGQRDPKTALQEEAARRRLEVRYALVATEGPPHARTFESRVLVGGEALGSGRGPSKQASERSAAERALRALRERPPC
jgi:ribonuclease III